MNAVPATFVSVCVRSSFSSWDSLLILDSHDATNEVDAVPSVYIPSAKIVETTTGESLQKIS